MQYLYKMYRLTKEKRSVKGMTKTFRYALVKKCWAKLITYYLISNRL